MNLLCWQGEEKLPRNCSCVNLTITFCNIFCQSMRISGTVTVTHYFSNEWTYQWEAYLFPANEWIVYYIGCNPFSYNYHVNMALADFIKEQISDFVNSPVGIEEFKHQAQTA